MGDQQQKRKLYLLAPHFEEDKDEDWMSELPLDKKTFIINKRAEILAFYERIESLRIVYRSHMTSLRDADPEKKAQAKREYEEKKKSFEETCDEKIRELLPHLRRLKTLGLELKQRMARVEAETSNKRRRLQDMLDPTLEMDPNVELVTDDYLPSYINGYLPQLNNTNDRNKRQQKSKKNTAEEVPQLQLKTSPIKNKDTFFDGVEDKLVRKVLADLRTEIVKYNCRDRVVKAIQSIVLRDQRITTMKSIALIGQMLKMPED